jgi:ribosomal-protein-alanine N-acetyltransferase
MNAAPACAVTAYRSEHIEDTWLIDRLCFEDPWLKRSLIEELDAACALNRVAADETCRVLGFCFGRIIADEYTIHRLAVHPAWQRRGIATCILHYCLRHAALHGMQSCHIEVRSGNTAALRLYEGFGFNRVGIRTAYYRVGSEDAILMQRLLGTARQDQSV